VRLKDIWKAMVEESVASRLTYYSTTAFIAMVRKFFAHVKWPRKTRLGVCTTCLQLQGDIEMEIMDLAAKKQLLATHLDFQSGQREAYYERRGLARNPHNSQY
jgi:hypothetical protein